MLMPQESLPPRRPNDASYLYVVNYDNFFRYLVYVEYECTNRCCVGIVGESVSPSHFKSRPPFPFFSFFFLFHSPQTRTFLENASLDTQSQQDYFACTLDRAKVNKSRYFRHRVDAEAISINGDERAVFVGQQQNSPYKHVCANSGCQLRPGPIMQDCRMELDP